MAEREKKLIISLGVIIYLVLFWKFNLTTSFPDIKENNDKLGKAQFDLEQLNYDLENIESKRQENRSLEVFNERSNNYVPSKADYSLVYEYVEKLTRLYPSSLQSLEINFINKKNNSQNNALGPAITAQTFDFTMSLVLTYDKFEQIVKLIEQSTLKAKIIGFNISKYADNTGFFEGMESDRTALDIEEELLDARIKVQLYSINMGNPDNFGERYATNSALVYKAVSTNSAFGLTKENINTPDLSFIIRSFLSGGHNIQLFGKDFSANKIAYSTTKRIKLDVKVSNEATTVSVVDSIGREQNITQSTPAQTLVFKLNCNFPRIKDNEYLGADIYLANDSTNNIRFIFDDTTQRCKIFDRDGVPIVDQSQKEKAQLFN